MNNSNIKKFLTRLFVVYSIQLIIKAFDYSFGGFFDFTVRGFVFTIFLIIMWVGGWYFAEYLNKKITDLTQIYKLLINIVIGYSITFSSNMGYRLGDSHLFGNADLWENIPNFNPEFTISMLLIYMMIYWFNEFFLVNIKIKEEEIKKQKIQKEFSDAKYLALKAQIEPHFLFNSLSVLNSIVHKNPDLASEFIIKLSKTLRYIVEKNSFKIVSLKEEMQLVMNYFFLLKTRFNESIKLTNKIDDYLLENCFIPPVTIQMLIENAIKHNKHSDENPLEVIIEANDEHITVQNTLNKKSNKEESTGKGIKNIAQRYELFTGKNVVVSENENFFSVKLPILKKDEYEHFNN